MSCKVVVVICFILALKLKQNCICVTINDELAEMFVTVPDNVTKVLLSKNEREGHALLVNLAYMLYGLRMIKPLLKTRYAVDYKEVLPLAEDIIKNGKPKIDKLNVTFDLVKSSFVSWPTEKVTYFIDVVDNLKLFISDIVTIIGQRNDGTFIHAPEPIKVFIERMEQKEYFNQILK